METQETRCKKAAAPAALFFNEADLDFRSTKDLDLVLLVEALTPEFDRTFWGFVREGGYENRQGSTGAPRFYRFSKSKGPSFPSMVELFARTDITLHDTKPGLTPIHIDHEMSSLSAILLDKDYYQLLVDNRTSADGITVFSAEDGALARTAEDGTRHREPQDHS